MSTIQLQALSPEEIQALQSGEDTEATPYTSSFSKWKITAPPTSQDRAATSSFILNGISDGSAIKDRIRLIRDFEGVWIYPGSFFGRGKARIVCAFTTRDLLTQARFDGTLNAEHLLFLIEHRHHKYVMPAIGCREWFPTNS